VAFTAEQEKDIRKYMGVPFGFYELNHRLESMMDLVGTNSTDQAQIVTWLVRLTEIDESLTGSDATSAAYGALKKVDEVEFYNTSETAEGSAALTFVQQGRVLIGRIAAALGVSDYLPYRGFDYFGSRRSSGFLIPLG